MTWDIASKIFIAVAALVGVIWQAQRTHGGRWKSIGDQLNIYTQLPEASSARSDLLAHIEAAITQQVASEDEKRRDPNGIILGIVFLGSAAGSFWAATTGGLWWLMSIPGAFFLLFGAVGLYQDAIPRKRDERGNAIDD